MRLKIILGSILAVAIVVVGCGGGGGDSTSGTSAGGTGATSTNAIGEETTSDGGEETTSDGGGGGETTSDSGGDGERTADGGKSSKPLTKEGFIAKGDAICGEIPTEYEALREEALKNKSSKGTKAELNLKAAVPPIYKAVEKFEELPPPKGEEAEVEAIIDSLEAAGKGLEEEPTAPLIGPKSPYDEFQKLTGKYGFSFCNQL